MMAEDDGWMRIGDIRFRMVANDSMAKGTIAFLPPIRVIEYVDGDGRVRERTYHTDGKLPVLVKGLTT